MRRVLDTAHITAQSGLTPKEARNDPEFFGHLTESAAGAHLSNAVAIGRCELFYWRDRNREVHFVARAGRRLVAIEVESTRRRGSLSGLVAFAQAFSPDRTLLIGGDGLSIEVFLSHPVEHWILN